MIAKVRPVEAAPWGETDPAIMKTLVPPPHVVKASAYAANRSQILSAAAPPSDRPVGVNFTVDFASMQLDRFN